MLLLLAALVAGADHPDFSGTWVLDDAASEPVDALLAAKDAGWVERQAAAPLHMVQRISQSPSTLIIGVNDTFIPHPEALPLDGTPQSHRDRKAGPTLTRTAWEGMAIVTLSVVATDDGTRRFTIRRTLEDAGKTMRQELLLQNSDGTTVKAKRLFRRRAQ